MQNLPARRIRKAEWSLCSPKCWQVLHGRYTGPWGLEEMPAQRGRPHNACRNDKDGLGNDDDERDGNDEEDECASGEDGDDADDEDDE